MKEKIIKKIRKKIQELERINQISREYSRLLNEEDENDRKTFNNEFMERTRRERAIMELDDLLKEITEEK